MRTFRLATVCIALLSATLVSGAALAKDARPAGAPKNLRGFLLKPNEPMTHVFARTPAFAWSPVRGARCYEFELATSRAFSSNSVVWSNTQDDAGARVCTAVPSDRGATTGAASDPAPATPAPATPGVPTTTDTTGFLRPLLVPAVSVDLVLPWFTGKPYALYARVRAVTSAGPSRWSRSFGFNMRWNRLPAPLATAPGMVRWSPVEGATGYQVWYPQIGKSFSTNTNAADLRDFYTFHRTDPSWWSSLKWRVRAIRRISGTVSNGLPPVSFGQWSPTYVGANPPLKSGALTLARVISDRSSTRGAPKAHELMPSVSFSGDRGLDGNTYSLFRSYVSTDSDCVNVVFRGTAVGSPAFAPRTSGPLVLPASVDEIAKATANPFPRALPDGDSEGSAWSADWRSFVPNEWITSNTGTPVAGQTTSPGAPPEGQVDESQTVINARVDLPDVDFPSTRYYVTVVPVEFSASPSDPEKKFGYHDVESPQDACQAGRIMSFGKESEPVRTGNPGGTPFVSGLNPSGRVLSASVFRPTVYSTPLVAWEPATGATAYQVQWSRTNYPWRSAGTVKTFATSAILDLGPGRWYYRVRGLNQTQVRRAEMAWSRAVALRVAAPRFSIAR